MSVEKKIETDIFSVVTEKVVELSTKLSEVVSEAAPEVWGMVLNVIRVDGGQSLVIGLFFMAIAIIGICVGLKFFKAAQVARDEYNKNLSSNCYKHSVGDHAEIAGTIIGAIVASMSTIISSALLLQIWNWVAVFAPELVLAKRLLDKLF